MNLLRSLWPAAKGGGSPCKICGGPSHLFDVVDFNKQCAEKNPYALGLSGVPVQYSRCAGCEFIFTRHFDGWDARRFARDVYNDDYAKVDGEYASIRPLRVAGHFAMRFPHAKTLSILDYGSGSSVFTERLNALGFERTADYDPYARPSRPPGPFDIVTCIEVMEHTPDPHGTMRDLITFAHADTAILFTTLTQPADIEQRRGGWWYIAPRNGHVSIYSEDALEALAVKHGLLYFPDNGSGFHAFSRASDTATLRLAACSLGP